MSQNGHTHSNCIRRDTPYAGKCRENADQNNAEYGHFLRRVNVWLDSECNYGPTEAYLESSQTSQGTKSFFKKIVNGF